MTVRKQLGLVALIPLFLAVAQAALISQSTNTVEVNVQMLSLLSQVRTEVQRLTKLELCGSPSDPVLQNIDRLLGLLINGDVKQALPPASGEFAEKLKPCLGTWARIKELIPAYRAAPTSSTELVQISEQFAQQTGDVGNFVSTQAVGGGGGLRMVLVTFIGLYALVIVLFYVASKKMGTTLDASIFSLTASAGEMSSTVELQERLAADQASATNETTSTMEELLASARISAEQAEAAATQSQQVLHFSQEGVDAVNQIIEGLGNLKENVTAIAQQILDLSEQIGQIGDITNAVSELASQTNMLALNAAVEAARAGQEGKGFAVVASEIRKLAEQSNRSAERIGALVAGLQKAANSTVMVTEAGTKTVDASTELAQSTQGTFDQLSAATQDAFENAQQISLNVRQQVEAVGQVLEAMNTLNASAKDSAAGIAQAQQGIAKLNETAELLQSKL